MAAPRTLSVSVFGVLDRAWYAVRCLFKIEPSTYEERITIWLAKSPEEAIDKAEGEAIEYADELEEYLGFAQSFHLFNDPTDGSEVFSLMRDSDLDPDQYIARFFDTGGERIGEYGEQPSRRPDLDT